MTRREDAFGWTFVTPLFLGSALNPINSSIIATALVPIASGVHVSVGRTSVLVSALYLASSVAQPTAGKLAEEFGPRRVFLSGVLLVLFGGLVGGLGGDLATLVVARVLIGIGTSAGYPSAMVLIRRRAITAGLAAPPGNVLGGLAIAGMATLAVGPPIGGLLVGALGWRAAFLVNLPVTAIALAMAVWWIPRDPPVAGPLRVREVAARVDVAGIIAFAGTITALLVFLMSLPRVHWIGLAVAIALAVALVWWELRAATPFFDVRRLAADLDLTRTYLRAGLTLLGIYTVFYGFTQWVEAARGYSAEQAGLLMLPMGLLSIVVSRPFSRRNLVRAPLVVAASSLLVAAAGLLFLTVHSPLVLLLVVTLIFGITTGTTTVGNQTALYAQAPAERIGTAAGLLRTFGYLGSIASATITGVAFRDRVTDHGLHTVAFVLVGVGALVLLMTVADRHLTLQGDTVTDTPPAIDARHAALLVMDYQPAIVGSIAESEALLARVAGAIATVRDHGGQVGYVRVAFEDSDYTAIPATNKIFAARANGRYLSEGTPESAVHDAVAPRDGDIMVRKTRVGAFSTTELDRLLREKEIDTLILAGISTSGVVLSTVRDAADRDYRIFVLSDGSADPDVGLHATLTEKVFPRQAHVITTAQLPGLLAA